VTASSTTIVPSLPGPNSRPETVDTLLTVLDNVAGTIAMIDVPALQTLLADTGRAELLTDAQRRMLAGAHEFRLAMLTLGPPATLLIEQLSRWIMDNVPHEVGAGPNPANETAVDIMIRLLTAELSASAERPPDAGPIVAKKQTAAKRPATPARKNTGPAKATT